MSAFGVPIRHPDKRFSAAHADGFSCPPQRLSVVFLDADSARVAPDKLMHPAYIAGLGCPANPRDGVGLAPFHAVTVLEGQREMKHAARQTGFG